MKVKNKNKKEVYIRATVLARVIGSLPNWKGAIGRAAISIDWLHFHWLFFFAHFLTDGLYSWVEFQRPIRRMVVTTTRYACGMHTEFFNHFLFSELLLERPSIFTAPCVSQLHFSLFLSILHLRYMLIELTQQPSITAAAPLMCISICLVTFQSTGAFSSSSFSPTHCAVCVSSILLEIGLARENCTFLLLLLIDSRKMLIRPTRFPRAYLVEKHPA